jgi:hypothetical protein
MDWQLASLNNPYLGIFKEAKKAAAERGASWATDAKELKTQLDILEAGMGGQPWLAGQAISLADVCLGRSFIAASIFRWTCRASPAQGVARQDCRAAGFQEGDGIGRTPSKRRSSGDRNRYGGRRNDKAAIIGLGTMGPASPPPCRGPASPCAASTPMPTSGPARRRDFRRRRRARQLGMPDKSQGAAIAVCGTLADCVAGADLVLETYPKNWRLRPRSSGRQRPRSARTVSWRPTPRAFPSARSRISWRHLSVSSACTGRTRPTSFR